MIRPLRAFAPLNRQPPALPRHALATKDLRDEFAGRALTGLLAQSNRILILEMLRDGDKAGEKSPAATFARMAYEQADAMLVEREKRG